MDDQKKYKTPIPNVYNLKLKTDDINFCKKLVCPAVSPPTPIPHITIAGNSESGVESLASESFVEDANKFMHLDIFSPKSPSTSAVENSYENSLCTSVESSSLADDCRVLHVTAEVIRSPEMMKAMVCLSPMGDNWAKFVSNQQGRQSKHLENAPSSSHVNSCSKIVQNVKNATVSKQDRIVACIHDSQEFQAAVECSKSPLLETNPTAILGKFTEVSVETATSRVTPTLKENMVCLNLDYATENTICFDGVEDFVSSEIHEEQADMKYEESYNVGSDSVDEVDENGVREGDTELFDDDHILFSNSQSCEHYSSQLPTNDCITNVAVNIDIDDFSVKARQETQLDAFRSSPITISFTTANETIIHVEPIDARSLKYAKVYGELTSETSKRHQSLLKYKGACLRENTGDDKKQYADKKFAKKLQSNNLSHVYTGDEYSGKVKCNSEEIVSTQIYSKASLPSIRSCAAVHSSRQTKESEAKTRCKASNRKDSVSSMPTKLQTTEERQKLNKKMLQKWFLEKERQEMEKRYRQRALEQYNKEIQKRKMIEEEKRRKESFQNWLLQKETQKTWERILKDREEEEKKRLHEIRSRESSELAFREWLRRKKRENQNRNKGHPRLGEVIMRQRQRPSTTMHLTQRINSTKFFDDYHF